MRFVMRFVRPASASYTLCPLRPRPRLFAIALTIMIAFGALFPASLLAQTSRIPLPDTRLVREELRRRALEAGLVPPGASTPRTDRLASLQTASRNANWLNLLEDLWRIPDGGTPARVRAEAGLQYSPPVLSNGYRELRVTEELSFLTVRGVAGGEAWELLMEVDLRERWYVEGRDWWNLPRTLNVIDRQFLRRASLGVAVGPFLVELGRLGRNWSVGRTGGLMLGGEVRFFDGIAAEAGGDTWAFELLYAPLEPGLTASERAVIPDLGREAYDEDETSVYMHRLTWRPRPNLRLGLTEGAVFYGRRPSIADLGPVLIQHDRYRHYDNLMWSFDGSWYPRPGLGLYAELAVDDLRAPTESEETYPSSLGFLAGAEALQGPWEAYFEVVWTSERLYRCRHPLGCWQSRLRFGTMTDSYIPDYDQPLGHWVGPDALGIFTSVTRTLPVGTFVTSGDSRGVATRGITPAARAMVGLHFSYRLHRSLGAPAGKFPRPVDLTNPDDAPQSMANITTAALTLQWPLWHIGWLEGGVTGVHMESEPLGSPSSPAYSDWGIEFRLGLRLFLL